jgi:hypothetical protein
MTTDYLVGKVRDYKFFRDQSIHFNPGEVYFPANSAQREIMTSLRAIEGSCYLALAALTQEYSYSAVAISSSTQTNPSIVTTAAAHGYTTGDSVIINAHLVNTAINGTNIVTVLSPTTFSVPLLGNGVGGATGSAYHALMQAFEVIHARKTGAYFGRLDKKAFVEIEDARQDYGASSTFDKVNKYYEVFGSSYTFGVQGIPASSGLVLQLRFYRVPLPFEEISSTVDPILPSIFDRLLYLGTVNYLIENLSTISINDKKAAEPYKQEVERLYGIEFNRLAAVLAEQRRPRVQGSRPFRL